MEKLKPMEMISYLGEDNYTKEMLSTVLPYIKQFKTHGVFSSYDNTQIYYECYVKKDAKANIVIAHGFCEFTGKFQEIIYQFLQAGFSVFIIDHRGHGRSKRFVDDKGMVHIESYNEYVEDLYSFVHTIAIPLGNNKPFILFGHSMGGAISALYLEHHPNDFCCAILSSPMLQINFGKIPEVLVQLITTIARLRFKTKDYLIGHSGFDGKYSYETGSASSKARYDYIFQIREKDDNYQTYGANYHWMIASIKALREIHKNAHKIKTPILLFQAENDALVKSDGQNRFIESVQNGTRIVVPKAKHEIFNGDLEMRKDFLLNVLSFINKNMK